MCRRMLIFWAMNVTRRRSLQESMALQRWAQLCKEKQKFPEQKWVFELTTPGEAALVGGWGISQGAEKSLRDSRWILDHYDFKNVSKNFFCTFWKSTSFMQEINKFCWGKLVNYCSYTGIAILALIIFENTFFSEIVKKKYNDERQLW